MGPPGRLAAQGQRLDLQQARQELKGLTTELNAARRSLQALEQSKPAAEPAKPAPPPPDTRPRYLSAELVDETLHPIHDKLVSCLRQSPDEPKSVRIAMVISGSGW